MRAGQPSRTAMMVALWRSLADAGVTSVPGFRDPGAAKLLGGRLWPFLQRQLLKACLDPRQPTRARLEPWVDGLILRVAFIDAVLAEVAPRQVVILGAGLDTRAWRLPALRGVPVFEVDHPATQGYKRAHAGVLGAPLADLRYVAVDFTRDDLGRRLREAGHDGALPTLWIWEGVTMYLGDAALRSTLAVVRAGSAPGSRLLVHYHEGEPRLRARNLRKLMFSLFGEPQIGLRSRQVMRAELTGAGFTLLEDAGLDEQAARVGAAVRAERRLEVSRIMVAT